MLGAEMIAAERQRQIEDEGWAPLHDKWHTNYELSSAACCYAQPGSGGPYSHPRAHRPPPDWPWDAEFWKPSRDCIKNLVRAGALIAAEIDRLQAETERKAAGGTE